MKKCRNGRLGLVAAGALVFVALGCSSLQKLVPENANVSQRNGLPGFGRTNTAAVSDPLTEKTNLYIKTCVNTYSTRIQDSYERYGQWVKNVENGPTGKESIVYGLYEISGTGQDCLDAINKAKNSEPDLPAVEANADSYAAAMKEAVSKINEIYPYYDREDYKDDNFARGKEFHPTLLKAFKDFEAANKTFLADVDKLEDEVAQNNLKDFADKPDQRFDYLVTKSAISSKKILKQIEQTEFANLSAAELQPLIEDFEKNTNELKTIPTDGENAMRRPMASSYISSAEDFLKSSKELMRRVRDKKPFTNMELRMGEMTDGTPQNVVREYNELISRQNSLR